jgi:hypothetical protein
VGAPRVLRLRAAGRTEHPQRRVAVVGLVAGGLPRQTSRGGATRSDREGKARHWRGTGSDGSSRGGRRRKGTLATQGAGDSLGTTLMVLNGGFGTFVGWKFCPVPSPQPGVTVLPPR